MGEVASVLIPIAFALCLILILAWTLWGLRCNDRTAHDRRVLIDAIFAERNEYQTYLPYYEAVSYDEHLRARQFFRDPWQLYDQRLIERMRSWLAKEEAVRGL